MDLRQLFGNFLFSEYLFGPIIGRVKSAYIWSIIIPAAIKLLPILFFPSLNADAFEAEAVDGEVVEDIVLTDELASPAFFAGDDELLIVFLVLLILFSGGNKYHR